MGKKKGGKSSGNVSAGVHSNVSRATLRAMRKGYMASGDRIMNQRIAYEAGKNVMITIPNPNENETNKRFIRISAREAGWRRSK
jgi:hypothetical protein